MSLPVHQVKAELFRTLGHPVRILGTVLSGRDRVLAQLRNGQRS